jgi:hypothetical protein
MVASLRKRVRTPLLSEQEMMNYPTSSADVSHSTQRARCLGTPLRGSSSSLSLSLPVSLSSSSGCAQGASYTLSTTGLRRRPRTAQRTQFCAG